MSRSILLRVIFLLLLAGLWYGGFLAVAAILTLVYSFRYTAYELIVLGWVIDMQFSTGGWPVYMLVAATLFLVVEWIKPRLLAYTVEQ